MSQLPKVKCLNMKNSYRVIFEAYDKENPETSINRTVLIEDSIEKPTSILDFSMGLDKQIALIKAAQDCLLGEKSLQLTSNLTCSCCQGKLKKYGNHSSVFHDVFTYHQVTIKRLRCTECGKEEPSTIRTIFNGIESAELMKIQSELGAKHTFRESEHILSLFSNKKRQINNHDRIKQTAELVGETLDLIVQEEVAAIVADPAVELILNVDGGHIKTTEDKRSIEAMTSVIYDQETRQYISSKHCAASVKDDGGSQLITNTIVAALKQGLTNQTHITALCDGAANCWRVAEALRPLCGSMTCILDWFHLAMKIQNISLPETHKEELASVKWHLWRGNVDKAQTGLSFLITKVEEKYRDRLAKLLTYITNNKDKIVDYNARKEEGKVFTSNLAESTVESLINQRCKGHQHMRWSREGLNPLLQLRAAIASDDWGNIWKIAVINALKQS